MALTKCSECGKEISTEAKSCPNCGAKPAKKVGLFGIVFVSLFGIMVFKCSSETNRVADQIAVVEAAKTPEQKAAEENERTVEKARRRAAREMVKLVKKQAKDPESVKFIEIAVSPDANLVCATYRAKNSFNALVPGSMVIRAGLASSNTEDWQKHCLTAPSMRNYTGVA